MSQRVGDARYVSVATFRRDGREVRTPVWIAEDPARRGRHFVYTNRTFGKVKRIRHTARVRLAPCDVRGNVANGARWVDADAAIVSDPAAEARGIAVLRDKYGWQMALLLLGARLSGRWKDRCVLEISTRAERGAPAAPARA